MPPIRELDLVGIVDVFASANRMVAPENAYRLQILTLDPRGRTAGMQGLHFTGGTPYTKLAGEVDTFLVPGGSGIETGSPSPSLLRWLKKRAPRCRRFGSICTGAFLLAQAGLLDGKRATTHWAFAKELAARFPKVQVDPDPIWIQDGAIYTSAGVTSGIDLCLALVEEDHGSNVALAVARMLVVFLRRPGNQAQFSVSLAGQSAERRPLRDLQVWMAENLRKALSVPELAGRVAMSPRNFQRVFTKELGKSPAHYLEELRVEASRRKLERTAESLDEIAAQCGFGSADVMGRSFQRLLASTPGEYRSRFRSSGSKRPVNSRPSEPAKPNLRVG